MSMLGWRFEGTFPNHPKFVAIVAPHTSNWDFPILLLAKWALRLEVNWMGKDAIFKGPVGVFLRKLGGIPITRTAAHNVVDRLAQSFRERPQMVLALAPEGTRKLVTEWKSGFWHIAHAAGVPIVCIALDYGRKTIRLGPEFETTGLTAQEGIVRIRESYAGVQGKHPELFSAGPR